jgi:putative glutamine amidotransferase
MKTSKRKPVVLIPADVKQIGEHPFHAVGQKYILAVAEAAGAMPLLVPAISQHLDIDDLLAVADGVLLTGSPSNVHPSHFGQQVHNPDLPLDLARDALTLKLIKAAIAANLPLLAICRGFQELNVAFGGSLHQAVQEVAGKNDHREAKELDLNMQYAPVHSVSVVPNGKLANILGQPAIIGQSEIMVNSLHGQGIDKLGAGLTAEAYAADGLVEAVSVDGASTFALGLQWHPEWKVLENPQYSAIFKAFGEACRAEMLRRIPPD